MLTKRIIPCLDIRGGRVVKGVNFENVRDLEDPVTLARYYNAEGADELAFYDIIASTEGRAMFTDVLEKTAAEVSIPLTAGGGISSVDDFDRVLNCGANKVSINTGALKNPSLIEAAAKRYGTKCVVLSIDVKRAGGTFRVFKNGGQEDTGRNAADWALYGQEHGAGELVINSIDTDGVRKGFDIELLKDILAVVSVPVIASGGAGSMEHFLELFKEAPTVDAGLAASIFHKKEVSIADLKAYLLKNGVGVRK